MLFKLMSELQLVRRHLVAIESKLHCKPEELQLATIDDHLPITTVAEYKSFDQELIGIPGKQMSLVKLVKSIGGCTISDAVQTAWDTITTVECRALCNMLGQKKADVKSNA
ncbi:hypothetical protein OUZ56_025992 [Daphnia magna]|uniref:Uncharacterized protein n=1 Tax=Daphnia magna TaxID=35525 RepID=A0ABQ9ZKJ6_9CRUS|nr:hypothetical protein OUZ56_025992 [Daphnia magna]